MLYSSSHMENDAVLATAARMCAAARTAPKTRGIDNILTMVLVGDSKDELADKMAEVNLREFKTEEGSFTRDANNVRAAQAVVLIGVRTRAYAGLKYCSFCGYESCKACKDADGRCAYIFIDLGIALSSAVSVAADDRVDNRIMYSIGKTFEEMEQAPKGVLWHGIPISVSGKNVFFDRK
ncbi:MAG: DUF2148 domain-containing protein [Christensenellales bacterium]|jgi:uncharacterized ferredoxin-like protein